jgi:hypothetical protein
MLGRLPWFALLRRIRALRLLVFFDIGIQAYGCLAASPRDPGGQPSRPGRHTRPDHTQPVETTARHRLNVANLQRSNLQRV